MIVIKALYPGFKKKCLTFSYDDGVIQDKVFLDKIKNTCFKATFNLNSGLFSTIKYRDGKDNSRLDNKNLKEIYQNHEISAHSLYHFHMENLDYKSNLKEISSDILNLKEIFSCDILGFAYPFGKYNSFTVEALKKCGIKYARTTLSTYDFSLPDDFIFWNPSIHHNDEKLIPLVDKFLNTDKELSLLYIWGHTYEFENQNNWGIIDNLISLLNNKDDIAYLTNIEIYNYINALRSVIINNNEIYNNSSQDLYLQIDETYIILKPHEKIAVKGEFLWKKY